MALSGRVFPPIGAAGGLVVGAADKLARNSRHRPGCDSGTASDSDGSSTRAGGRAGVGEDELIRTWDSYVASGVKIKAATGAYLVAHARAAWPDLLLEPHVDLGAALEQRLESGELDFAVVAGYSSRSAIASEPIANVRFSWAASPALAGPRRAVTAALLQDTALITMPPAAGPTRMLEHWLAVNNLEAGRRLTCNNLAAIASLIAAGVGIGLFPHGWLQQMAQRGAVVQLSSRPALPELEYTFQWRRDDTRPLLAHLRDAVARTVDFSKPSPLW